MGVRRRLGNASNPLIKIEWIICLQTIIGGVWLLSPYLNIGALINVHSPLVAAVASPVGLIVFSVFTICTALLVIAGIITRRVKWRSAGLFLNGLVRLYAFIATVVANGIFPLTWLSSAALMVITFYIWGRIRKRGVE